MTLPALPESCTVCTPTALATALVRALDDEPTSRWLEPCVGNGALLRALSDIGVSPNRITGLDLLQTPRSDDELAQITRGTDFLEWSRTFTQQYDRIVANPPYIALNRLDPILQESALTIKAPDGQSISLGANYWYAFVCASLALLRSGGNLGFILPAAWDYADYAAPIRQSIPKRFARFEVHRSSRPVFNSVQDGCVVILGRGFGQSNREVVRYEHDSAEDLVSALQGRQSFLFRSRKTVVTKSPSTASTRKDTYRLGDILDIRLGGVTGDTDYFLLTESKRLAHGLPVSSLRPAVTKAHHLISGELTRQEWETLRDKGERIWLFDPPPGLMNHPAVQAYLGLSPEDGGCRRDRYKIKNRNPWYHTPLPRYVHGFVSGMTQSRPWICLRSMPRLTATNTLYTVRYHGSLTPDEKAAWALSLLTSYSRNLLESTGRVYPDGLLKYEPGDLLDLPLLAPPKIHGARARYLEAVRDLLCNDVEESKAKADRWFDLPQNG